MQIGHFLSGYAQNVREERRWFVAIAGKSAKADHEDFLNAVVDVRATSQTPETSSTVPTDDRQQFAHHTGDMLAVSLSSGRDDVAGEARVVLFGVRAQEDSAKPVNRSSMQLTHPRLGDTEDLADLGEGQAFEVVEAENDLVPLGQLRDRLGDLAAAVLVDEHRDRVDGVVVGGVPTSEPLSLPAATKSSSATTLVSCSWP